MNHLFRQQLTRISKLRAKANKHRELAKLARSSKLESAWKAHIEKACDYDRQANYFEQSLMT